jgi:predicted amino acid-binding ACT domain protein
MTKKPLKGVSNISRNGLVGSLSWGENQPQIFLALCEAYSDLGLDIIEVDSHVRKGWFSKMIVARARDGGLNYSLFKRRIQKVSSDHDFSSACFPVSESDGPSSAEANVVIVIQGKNSLGLLAKLLKGLNECDLDIIDIDLWMDEHEKDFALNLHVHIAKRAESFLGDIEKIRNHLRELRADLSDDERFKFMVHSSETYDFLQRIDYEK